MIDPHTGKAKRGSLFNADQQRRLQGVKCTPIERRDDAQLEREDWTFSVMMGTRVLFRMEFPTRTQAVAAVNGIEGLAVKLADTWK